MSLPERIFLGDLARALDNAGEADWPAIAGMLGFRLDAGDGERVPLIVTTDPVVPPLPRDTERRQIKDEDQPAATSPDTGALVEFEMLHSTAPPESVPPISPGADAPTLSTPPALRPLFHALWERGILLAMAGTLQPEGELDVIEAVKLIARGEGWRELPVEKIQSVSKGCQILVDAGLGMQPFAADTRQLVRSLRLAVGAEHVRVLTFVDCPTRGVLTQAYEDDAYRAPENGATVIAVSDVCSGGPRTAIRETEPEAWFSVAKRVRDAGSAFVVLNPYPPNRWPSRLAEKIPMIHWHMTTQSADVRRTRRRLGS